jgi:hypothetical protein
MWAIAITWHPCICKPFEKNLLFSSEAKDGMNYPYPGLPREFLGPRAKGPPPPILQIMILKLSPPRCVISKESVQQKWIDELWFRKQLCTCLFVWTLNFNDLVHLLNSWVPKLTPLSVGLSLPHLLSKLYRMIAPIFKHSCCFFKSIRNIWLVLHILLKIFKIGWFWQTLIWKSLKQWSQ